MMIEQESEVLLALLKGEMRYCCGHGAWRLWDGRENGLPAKFSMPSPNRFEDQIR